jgi:predicted nuclease of predicted toxin-antitoxin system
LSLLFDENLSESLVVLLADLFPGSQHVRLLGFQGQDDEVVAAYAGENGLTVATKDSDFVEVATFASPEFRVIWIRLGNCTTANVHLLLRKSAARIFAFLEGADQILELPTP